jgi:hypothetical protein
MTVPPRLAHLLKLADQGPALRAALVEEVTDLLAKWPADYPAEMRGVCEQLLARAEREGKPESKPRPKPQTRERALITAARLGKGVGEKLAQILGVATSVAEAILRDPSAKSLAVAARAANMPRCDFSALVLLAHPKADRATAYARLAAYDDVAMTEATRALRAWRTQRVGK